MSKSLIEKGNFFDIWAIYQKILDNNYMFHKELYLKLEDVLKGTFDKTPFNLLDLGCGDASFLVRSLKDCNVNHYTGIDISSDVIPLAERNIESLNCKAEFINTDVLEGLKSVKKGFYNVIFSSFAIHHLTTDEKIVVFKQCKDLLADDGLLILIDFIRENDETFEDCMGTYGQYIQDNWKNLTTDELKEVIGHCWERDHPETILMLKKMSEEAGFKKFTLKAEHVWLKMALCEI